MLGVLKLKTLLSFIKHSNSGKDKVHKKLEKLFRHSGMMLSQYIILYAVMLLETPE